MPEEVRPEEFWGKRRVVVTGGAGFLGRYVVDGLRRRGVKEIFVPTIEEYNLVQPEAITHMLRDSRPDVAAEFARRYECEAVRNYDDMVSKVDAMIYAGFYETKWWPQLTKPYLEASIPCHINRL